MTAVEASDPTVRQGPQGAVGSEQAAGPVGGVVHRPIGPAADDDTRQWVTALAARIRSRLPPEDAPGPAPAYGSDEWLALHPNHPLRFVALLNAAEAWRHEQTDLPRQLEAELSAARWAREQVEAEQFADVARRVRATAGSPSYDELERRRAVPTRPPGYQPRAWPSGATA